MQKRLKSSIKWIEDIGIEGGVDCFKMFVYEMKGKVKSLGQWMKGLF